MYSALCRKPCRANRRARRADQSGCDVRDRAIDSRASLGSFPGDLRDRSANAGIRSTAADVAAEFVDEIFRRGIGMLVEHRLTGNHKARRAKAALRSVIVDEG